MEMHVLHGADDEAVRARRAALLAGHEGFEDLSCAEDQGEALVAAVECPSLFGGRRVVACDELEQLSDVWLKRLVAAAPGSDAFVVARAATLPAALAKALGPIATVQGFSTPKGASIRSRVTEIAARHGVTLDAASTRLLVERAGHDLDRVASVCTQLALAGMTRPGERQVSVLLGSCAPAGVPWAVADALDDGDTVRAVAAAGELSGIAVLAYLAGQVESAARVLEAGASSQDQAAAVLGVSPFVAAKALRWARALGPHGVRAALGVLAEADRRAKSSIGERDAAAAAIVKLAALRS